MNAIVRLSSLYPPAIVQACGGAEKFNELKTVDCEHLERVYGAVKNEDAITEPIMVGENEHQRVFIILTFDVYNSKGEKIEEKISEVFHHSHRYLEWGLFEWDQDLGSEVWYGSYKIYGQPRIFEPMPILEIAERIQLLLRGNSVVDEHLYSHGNGKTRYIRLWNKDSH